MFRKVFGYTEVNTEVAYDFLSNVYSDIDGKTKFNCLEISANPALTMKFLEKYIFDKRLVGSLVLVLFQKILH